MWISRSLVPCGPLASPEDLPGLLELLQLRALLFQFLLGFGDLLAQLVGLLKNDFHWSFLLPRLAFLTLGRSWYRWRFHWHFCLLGAGVAPTFRVSRSHRL